MCIFTCFDVLMPIFTCFDVLMHTFTCFCADVYFHLFLCSCKFNLHLFLCWCVFSPCLPLSQLKKDGELSLGGGDILNDCLTIHQLRPEGSPMDHTDSGLGRSPHGSMPGTSSDIYPSECVCVCKCVCVRESECECVCVCKCG